MIPEKESSENRLKLWYRQPARTWMEALPVGNGRLGAMVFGGVYEERLQLNEDTLWSGAPKDWNNLRARELLPEVRRLLEIEVRQLGRLSGVQHPAVDPRGALDRVRALLVGHFQAAVNAGSPVTEPPGDCRFTVDTPFPPRPDFLFQNPHRPASAHTWFRVRQPFLDVQG